jgi:hypothetical protein
MPLLLGMVCLYVSDVLSFTCSFVHLFTRITTNEPLNQFTIELIERPTVVFSVFQLLLPICQRTFVDVQISDVSMCR